MFFQIWTKIFIHPPPPFFPAANGIYQNSLYGLAASFPAKYTNAVIIGNVSLENSPETAKKDYFK